jgi:hypothetical protein
MAGRTSAYLLRPNKAVDRLLFADLLDRLDASLSIGKRFKYIGMGAAYMEDFRLLHERFPRMRMVSLEELPHVYSRQRFNRPHSAIKFLQHSTRQWIEQNIPSKSPHVIWLDFQGKQRQDQISQFQSLVMGAAKPSILRITLDASIETLGGNSTPAQKLERLKSQLGDLIADDTTADDIVGRGLEEILRDVVLRAASRALRSQPSVRFQPLLVVSYKDTSRVLTITGLLCDRDKLDAVASKSGLYDWEYSWLRSNTILKIDLPELSARERLALNQMLPVKAKSISHIHKAFGFWLAAEEAESEKMLASYIQFARHYPQFARVSV